MSLPIRGTAGLSSSDIRGVKCGTWIAERLNANTYQGERTEAIAFGRPRRVIKILFCGETRKRHAYVNCIVAFGEQRAAITLVQGQSRFKIATKPALFDLAKFSKNAEHSSEVSDL